MLQYVDVLDTNSPQVFVYAPEGHMTLQRGKVDHFLCARRNNDIAAFLD
jgi:hypothetical protein